MQVPNGAGDLPPLNFGGERKHPLTDFFRYQNLELFQRAGSVQIAVCSRTAR
ncbi:hypothetical protein [Sporolactobacillus putidus]|uniref:Uncharacterized protein n=1 Tax=Sporolactobacillus putidus TaxID=492735 RepID=A0A917RY43_9BACL|nr:hypothetical protein [Sporolactobacillus putidus]GGL41936.1 hypothetical protein GCM10007968_02300 [Sporolactobacillus putidus]